MILPSFILLPFSLLVLAIILVWLPPMALSHRVRIVPWMLCFVAAIVSASHAGHLTWTADVALAAFAVVAYLSAREGHTDSLSSLLLLTLLVMAGFFATHNMPGFHNPRLLYDYKFSPDALPYTQYANFDKGAAGLILLSFFCARTHSWRQWSSTIARTLPIALVTCAAVSGIAIALRYSHVDFKLPAYTPIFLITNLFFTCVAEEALFRGVIQHRLSRWLNARGIARGSLVALLGTALLFGLVHTGGGVGYVLLATIAGLGYGYAYLRTGKIEAPILVHFCVNAVHFLGFTYPRLA